MKLYIHEYKYAKDKLGREIYIMLLKLLDTPPQKRLQREVARLFRLLSRRGLSRARAQLAQQRIEQDHGEDDARSTRLDAIDWREHDVTRRRCKCCPEHHLREAR